MVIKKSEEEIKIPNLYEYSLKEVQDSYKLTRFMSVVVFLIGIASIAISVGLFLSNGNNNLVGMILTSSIGIVALIILFMFYDPRRQAQESITRLMNLKLIFLAYNKAIQEAEVVYQESKGTPTEEIASAVKQEVQKWEISDQEQMTRNVESLIFSLKARIPNIEANRHIFLEIESIKRERDLVKQYQRVPILISLIPHTVIIEELNMGDIVKGDKIKIENVQGDVIGVGVKGKGNIIAKEVSGTINLNFHEYNNISDDYVKSLQEFSDAVNVQLKKYNISQEKAAPVQESINEFAKEVEGIKPEEKIDIEKKENIKGKITKVAIRLLKILPEGAETVATFTPLAPFSKIIGKGLEEIVNAIQNEVQRS